MNPLHTAGNAVPTLDGTDLDDVIDGLRGIHPGLDLIADAAQLIATDRLDRDQTQTITAKLAGCVDTDAITLIRLLVERLTDADTNPSLRDLPLATQEKTRKHIVPLTYDLTHPNLHQPAAEAAAAIAND